MNTAFAACIIAGGKAASVNYNGTEYYYLRNAQGDIVKLIYRSKNTVVEYTCESWEKSLLSLAREQPRLAHISHSVIADTYTTGNPDDIVCSRGMQAFLMVWAMCSHITLLVISTGLFVGNLCRD